MGFEPTHTVLETAALAKLSYRSCQTYNSLKLLKIDSSIPQIAMAVSSLSKSGSLNSELSTLESTTHFANQSLSTVSDGTRR